MTDFDLIARTRILEKELESLKRFVAELERRQHRYHDAPDYKKAHQIVGYAPDETDKPLKRPGQV